MNRSLLLPSAYLLDQIAGDPEWFPHPVRLMGAGISRAEAALRRAGQSNGMELATGAALALITIGATYWTTATILRFTRTHSSLLGDATELVLAWTCVAGRNLEQEATAVTNALQHRDLPPARQRVARIVGRDTADLDSQEISRAVIETVAESASDGVMAPMFYMALGGVPLAMAYKAVNTLDSMIGHADSRYFFFGKAAARFDDAANFLPSRITALALVAAAQIHSWSDPQAAWHTWLRDRSKHKSPNAGQPESAIAGALHVSLGGDNTYAGELVSAQRIGEEFPRPTPDHAIRAIRLVATASLVGLAFGVLFATISHSKRRG